jgi:hypothetical protein
MMELAYQEGGKGLIYTAVYQTIMSFPFCFHGQIQIQIRGKYKLIIITLYIYLYIYLHDFPFSCGYFDRSDRSGLIFLGRVGKTHVCYHSLVDAKDPVMFMGGRNIYLDRTQERLDLIQYTPDIIRDDVGISSVQESCGEELFYLTS